MRELQSKVLGSGLQNISKDAAIILCGVDKFPMQYRTMV